MARTVSDIAHALHVSHGYTKKDAEKIVKDTFDIISDALSKGDEVVLHGFGKFEVEQKPARKGRNPRTGQEIDIPAKSVVKFKARKELSDNVQ